jgi:hypothetical protein
MTYAYTSSSTLLRVSKMSVDVLMETKSDGRRKWIYVKRIVLDPEEFSARKWRVLFLPIVGEYTTIYNDRVEYFADGPLEFQCIEDIHIGDHEYNINIATSTQEKISIRYAFFPERYEDGEWICTHPTNRRELERSIIKHS